MSLVVEDGTGLSTADAYDSLANVDAYHAKRGRTDWAALSSTLREQAIVRATDYIDARFARRFRGERVLDGQALAWPRYLAYDNDGFLLTGSNAVPRQIKRAVAEYALISARRGELAPLPPAPTGTQAVATGTVTAATGASGVIVKKNSIVDVIDTSTTYADPSNLPQNRQSGSSLVSSFNIPEYPPADLWVEELLKPTGSGTVLFG